MSWRLECSLAWTCRPECKGFAVAYTDFTLDLVESELGIAQRPGPIFPAPAGVEPPPWLVEQLARGMKLALVSEKSRSEFIVAPILLAVRELSGDRVSILSGHCLDVDPMRRLSGECDFLLSLAEPLPRLRAPLLTVLEAKRNDIELGLGQCAAQMVAAQLFNERAGLAGQPVHGCVTTGGEWQFLRLDGQELVIDPARRYIDRLETVLAALFGGGGIGRGSMASGGGGGMIAACDGRHGHRPCP